jgi:PAS domain S-box-containing protein
VIRDITESQTQAEQHDRLMELLAKKGLVYFRADKDGRTVESSPAESKLTRYSSDELLGMNRELLYDEPSNRNKLIREVDQSDGRLVHTTQHLKRKNGTLFWAEGVIHLLKDADGQTAGYEGLYEDVTERLQLQGFLDVDTKSTLRDQEFYRKLKENVHFQLLFMSSVGHQLRSPLGALVQQLVNFQEGITDADRFQQRLKYVIGQARVCTLLVENLTFMDKILRGESFELKPVGLAKLAIETKLNFEHLALDKNLAINVDDKSLDKHPQVWGHRELIRQVLVNIVDNAIKYSVPSSHIRICGRLDQKGHYLQITNRGLPIPRQHRNRIFERGFRTREAEALIPAGTGLGLWLVRKICFAHGATIHCTEILEDNEQRTAFQISFPLGEMRRSIDVGGAA